MAGPALDSRTLRYRDGLEPLDAALFRFEAGLMTFALLAMSATYLLKIIFEALSAERSFVDSFLLRWAHGTESAPPAELVEQVTGVWSPLIVGVIGLVMGFGAARAILVQKGQESGVFADTPPAIGKVLGLGAAIILGFVLVGLIVIKVHSALLCGTVYGVMLVLFAMRARRRGELAAFVVMWLLLSVPIGVLIARIPGEYAWVNDLSKILIMYVGFVGASMASRHRKHIVLNFGRRLWPKNHQRAAEAVSLTVWLLFDLLLLTLALHLFELQYTAGSTLSILPIPEYHVVLPVVLSFVLMSARVAVDLMRVIRGTETYFVNADDVEMAGFEPADGQAADGQAPA